MITHEYVDLKFDRDQWVCVAAKFNIPIDTFQKKIRYRTTCRVLNGAEVVQHQSCGCVPILLFGIPSVLNYMLFLFVVCNNSWEYAQVPFPDRDQSFKVLQECGLGSTAGRTEAISLMLAVRSILMHPTPIYYRIKTWSRAFWHDHLIWWTDFLSHRCTSSVYAAPLEWN